jgi:two-component system, cell cycle sensor histidine kinase and response regulator CckA
MNATTPSDPCEPFRPHGPTERARELEAPPRGQEDKCANPGDLAELVICMDTELNILWANQAGWDSLGISRERLAGQPCYRFGGQRTEPCPDCVVVKAMRSGRTAETETVMADGRIRVSRGHPVFDANGKMIGGIELCGDVTDRRRGEEEVKRLSQWLLRTQRISRVGGWAMNLKTGEVWVSPEARRIYGAGKDERLTIAQVQSFTMPRNRGMLDLALRELVERGKAYDVEFQITRGTDGSVVEIHSLAEYNGEESTVQGVIEDITERKRADAALRQSEERFKLAMEANRDGLWDWDVETGEVYYSPGYAAMLGYTVAEVPAHVDWWRDLIHPEDREAALQANMDCVENRREDVEVEFRMRAKNGEWRWILGRGKGVARDASGRALRMVGTHTDITERREAEEALRRSEERSRALIERSHDAISLLGADGTILFDSAAITRVLGYSPTERVGRKGFEFVHPEDRTRMQQSFAVFVQQPGSSMEYQAQVLHRDGTARWIQGVRRNLLHEPAIQAVVVNYRDYTEHKTAEREKEKLRAQLTHAQKMESVGRLAGGVAHDFNNMLQAILGNVALALQDVAADSPLRENLEEIQKSAQRSAELTRQLLAFARKQTIQPRVLDLNDTVAGMLKMLRRLMGEDVDLAWMPGPGLWPVKVDPSQVDQILANLCVNARDAIAGIGKVMIQSANATLDEAYARTHPECIAGDYVMLGVSDTGQGIDEAARAHLFEPFFTTKEVGKGTGLGLATVFGIVKQNRGLIDVYSERGMGTTFKIYLPRAGAVLVAAEQKAVQASLHGSETVLLVEDEEQILNLGRRILEQLGYKVLTAASPKAALDLAAEHAGSLDLLITDVVMPGMNGKELKERLHSSHADLKCLFMSGYTADVIAHHGVLDDSVQFLQKPFTIGTLAEMVRKVLEQA